MFRILAIAAFSIGAVGCALGALVATIRKRKGVPVTVAEIAADDRRFLNRFLVSRIAVMTIVYSIALGIVLGLAWILGGNHGW